jgi:ABC-2 type transport system permease protein
MHLSLVIFKTILFREIRRILRIWQQTLLPPIIVSSLYFLIFGTFVGKQISDINGDSYISFIAPGLILMTVITNSYTNVASSFFSAKFQYSIEEILVSPASNLDIILGYVFGGMFRGISIGLLVFGVSYLFVDLHIAHPIFLILVLFSTSFLFSICGFANALFARKFDDISVLPVFVLTPMVYLGGIFFPLSVLSPFWQSFSQLNPMIYIINLFRYCFLDKSDVNNFYAFAILAILSISVFIAVYIMVSLRKGVRL